MKAKTKKKPAVNKDGAPRKKRGTPDSPSPCGNKIIAYGVSKALDQVANAITYKAIADEIGVSENGMRAWLERSFPEEYARAREDRTEKIVEELLDISDNGAGAPVIVDGLPLMVEGKPVMAVSAAGVQHAKLRVDTRKWLASKMLPRKYGDSQEVKVSGSLDLAATIIAARKRAGIAEDD